MQCCIAVPLFDEERVCQGVHGEAEQSNPNRHPRSRRHSAATRTAPILKRFGRRLRLFYTKYKPTKAEDGPAARRPTSPSPPSGDECAVTRS